MWSLPDIQCMNNEAVARHEARKKSKKEPWVDRTCNYCDKPATNAEEYFDIFDDKIPKGHICTCDEHFEYHGGAHEEYFLCDSCGHLMVENYTWERYQIVLPDDDEQWPMCLRCAFKKYVADKRHWLHIPPGNMGLDRLKGIPHVIAVDSHYHEKKLAFIGNAEFDSMDGHQISGEPIGDIAKQAIKEHGSCIILMDAAYQFAVSFGVYVKKQKPRRKRGRTNE